MRQAHSLAYRLTGNTADADDLVQETYVRAFRFFHRYDDGLPFTSWLFRIMTNVHIDVMRKRNRLKTTSLDRAGRDQDTAWDVADVDAAADRGMMDGQVDEAMQLALKAMSPDFRTAVVLADVEQLSYEEIAEITQVSVGTVRSRIHRGRSQLREYLTAKYPHLAEQGDQA
jgi:RNA polymerase sigma-70 factor (ECF subfamily)